MEHLLLLWDWPIHSYEQRLADVNYQCRLSATFQSFMPMKTGLYSLIPLVAKWWCLAGWPERLSIAPVDFEPASRTLALQLSYLHFSFYFVYRPKLLAEEFSRGKSRPINGCLPLKLNGDERASNQKPSRQNAMTVSGWPSPTMARCSPMLHSRFALHILL